MSLIVRWDLSFIDANIEKEGLQIYEGIDLY